MNQQQRRIAVIDDEDSARKMPEVASALEGFGVRGAVDGLEDISLIRMCSPTASCST